VLNTLLSGDLARSYFKVLQTFWSSSRKGCL